MMANLLNNRFTTNTYNPLYPWLNKSNYDKIIAYGNSLWLQSEEEKRQAENTYYRKNVNKMVNDQILDERDGVINEQAYQAAKINTKDADVDLRTTELSQALKRKYNLNATANDAELVDDFIKWLTPEWKTLAWKYLAWESNEFLYVTWLAERPKEKVEKKTFWEELVSNIKEWLETPTNIIGGAYDSVTWVPRFLAKWTAEAIWWAAKQLWADDDKVNSLVQGYKDYLDNDFSSENIWADQDSASYKISKTAWDIAQVAWWEALAKSAIQGTAKWAELVNYLKDAPTWQKIIAWWLEWAWDMTLYSIVSDSELPTAWEVGIGAAIGAAIPWVAAWYKAVKPIIKKWVDKIAPKLQLSWLLNPAKLNSVKNQLIDEGTDLAKAWLKSWEADDVGKWMIERGFKWDKPTIIKNLWEHAKKSHALKREVLWASKSLHTVESANKSLEAVHNTIKDVPWLEKKLARVEELMGKQQHTLSELDEIKSILDDTVSIYTNAWDVKAWAVKKWMDIVRKDLKKYIEDAATKEWLGNVKLLNNETQIAKALEDAISRKDSADAARELLSVFDKWTIWGWLLWGTVWWPFDNDSFAWKMWNVIVGALAWKYIFSTKTKTNIASALNKMSWWSKKELTRLIGWEIAAKDLSSAAKKWLEKIFKDSWISAISVPKELTTEEMSALVKNYSYSDLPKVIWASITNAVVDEE